MLTVLLICKCSVCQTLGAILLKNSSFKSCVWVLRIRGCTVELVNSLFVYLLSLQISHTVLFYSMNEGLKKL